MFIAHVVKQNTGRLDTMTRTFTGATKNEVVDDAKLAIKILKRDVGGEYKTFIGTVKEFHLAV